MWWWIIVVLSIATPVHAWSFGWLSGAFNWPTATPRQPTATRTVVPTATPPWVEATRPLEAPTPLPPVIEPGQATTIFTTKTDTARIVLTDLLPTAGGWAILWSVVDGDLWNPTIPTEVWYAHVGNPDVPALRLMDVHRIDRLPVYLASASPGADSIAVVFNELANWRTATASLRSTHQWFGRLGLDGQWIVEPSAKTAITTNLGIHGGIGCMVWSSDPTRPLGIVRVTTEATCSNPRHQCTYSQRVDPSTGKVTGRGSITVSYMGHQTAPQIIPFDAQASWLVTISDVAGKTGGLWARTNFLTGLPAYPIVPGGFRLDLDPRSVWNGVEGAGKRVGTLWRLVRTNDHLGNRAGEPFAMRFTTWDFVRQGTQLKPLPLSDAWLTEWTDGDPVHSRWNTGLDHLPSGGWAVGFQDRGQYIVGQLTEVGQWIWQHPVNPVIDYAGDVAVSRDGQRIGSVSTVQGDDGVRLELREDAVQ